MTPLKIVFAGTPEFAATALAALLDTPPNWSPSTLGLIDLPGAAASSRRVR
jgi:hypothetical protein